jgi:ribosomal protein L32
MKRSTKSPAQLWAAELSKCMDCGSYIGVSDRKRCFPCYKAFKGDKYE